MTQPIVYAIPQSSPSFTRFQDSYKGHIYVWPDLPGVLRIHIESVQPHTEYPVPRPALTMRARWVNVQVNQALNMVGLPSGVVLAFDPRNSEGLTGNVEYRFDDRRQVAEMAMRGFYDPGFDETSNALDGGDTTLPVVCDLWVSDPVDELGRRIFFVRIHDRTSLTITKGSTGLDAARLFDATEELPLEPLDDFDPMLEDDVLTVTDRGPVADGRDSLDAYEHAVTDAIDHPNDHGYATGASYEEEPGHMAEPEPETEQEYAAEPEETGQEHTTEPEETEPEKTEPEKTEPEETEPEPDQYTEPESAPEHEPEHEPEDVQERAGGDTGSGDTDGQGDPTGGSRNGEAPVAASPMADAADAAKARQTAAAARPARKDEYGRHRRQDRRTPEQRLAQEAAEIDRDPRADGPSLE